MPNAVNRLITSETMTEHKAIGDTIKLQSNIKDYGSIDGYSVCVNACRDGNKRATTEMVKSVIHNLKRKNQTIERLRAKLASK
jgi:hypothetical protein